MASCGQILNQLRKRVQRPGRVFVLTSFLLEISAPLASQKHMNADLAGTGRPPPAAAADEDDDDAEEDDSDDPLPTPRREGVSPEK